MASSSPLSHLFEAAVVCSDSSWTSTRMEVVLVRKKTPATDKKFKSLEMEVET